MDLGLLIHLKFMRNLLDLKLILLNLIILLKINEMIIEIIMKNNQKNFN